MRSTPGLATAALDPAERELLNRLVPALVEHFGDALHDFSTAAQRAQSRLEASDYAAAPIDLAEAVLILDDDRAFVAPTRAL